MKAATEGAKGYRRLIPSLTALVEFEAVAWLRSFTNAVAELGVTQAAVSHQVPLLEDMLGVRLLDRLHRNLTLTKEGEALYAVVSESMARSPASSIVSPPASKMKNSCCARPPRSRISA